MEIIVPVVLFIFALSGFSAYFIGMKVHNSLAKAANKNAKAVSIVTGVFSFVIILCGILFLLLANIPFSRE